MTRLRLGQFAALAVTLAVLAGLPWLATSLPWPSLDFSLLSWEVNLRSGRLPDGVGTAALIVALWSVWVLYLLALAAEFLAHLRRRPVHLGPLRPLQLLAATTLGTLTLAPGAAYAAPTTVAVAEAEVDDEPDQVEQETGEQQASTEPFVVDRSRVLDSFGYDSADLTKGMAEDVAATADLIAEHGAPELPIVVTGHTDAAGDPDYNAALSERRADAVAQELRTHLGEDAVVEVSGEGDRALLDGADDAEQRRVEISYGVVVTPPPADPPDQTQPEKEEEAGDDHAAPAIGLSLPGGLILAMTAAGAGAVAGMALERRREGSSQAPGPEQGRVSDEHESRTEPPSPPVAETHDDPPSSGPKMALLDLARVPGLGIVGPGSEAAARTLVCRALEQHEAELTVVLPEDDLRDLLDARRLPQLREDAAVMVTESIEDALTLLQLQVLARHRAADEAEEHDDSHPQDLARGPQFVLLTRTDPAVAAEVTSLLSHTREAPLGALLLGEWPDRDGPTLTLDARGTITGAEGSLADLAGHHWAGTTPAGLDQTLQGHREPPAEAPEPTEPETSEPAESDHSELEHDKDTRLSHHPGAETPTPAQESAQEPPPGTVSVTVLGPITLSVQGRQVHPHRRAAYEVLAYLAAHPQGVRLEAAAEAMWPEEAPHRGIRRFHDACTSVRSACRPLLGTAATTVITHEGDLYRLDQTMVVCDLWRIDDLLDQAAQAQDAAVLISSAASMLEGDFAAQTDYRWAEATRERISTRIVESLTDHSDDVDARRAISMLRRALNIDPMAEKAARLLARRYEEKGDKKSAERVLKDRQKILENAE